MRVKRGERGGWKKGTWGMRYREGGWWVYEKERASRIEGRETDQHNRHCQPTRSSRFYVWIWILDPSPHPGQGQPGQIIHIIPLRPLIVSAHTAPSVIPHSIWSAPFATGHCSLYPVLCSFPTSSALHRFASNPASEHSGTSHRLLRHAQTGRPVSLQTLQGTKH
jgi:hypothetical protein